MKLFLIILEIFLSQYSKKSSELTVDKYLLINNYFNEFNGEISVFETTISTKIWINLLNKESLDLFGDMYCDQYVDDVIKFRFDINLIESGYISSHQLDQTKLIPKIKLSSNYSEDAIKISEPIILNDLGILYIETNSHQSLLVFKKKGNTWKNECKFSFYYNPIT